MNIVRIVYLSMVRFRLLRLFIFIQKMDVWRSVSVYGKLSLQLYCAQVTCQKISREVGQKLSGYFFNFCPTINDADSDIYLR